MVTEYRTSARIDAPPERVWDVLVDTAAWPSWGSGVLEVEGRVEPGAKLRVRSAANPKRAFPVKVTELARPRRMTWTGGMPLGLFKGVRTYVLEPDGAGTRFEMREVYSGPLLALIGRTIPDLQPSFDTFGAGLKERVEATSTPAR